MFHSNRFVSRAALEELKRRIPGLNAEQLEGLRGCPGAGELKGLRFSVRYHAGGFSDRAGILTFKLFAADGCQVATSATRISSLQDGEPTDKQWVALVCDLVSSLARVEREWMFQGVAPAALSWLGGSRTRPQNYVVLAKSPVEAYSRLPAILGAEYFAQAKISPEPLLPDALANFGDPLKFEVLPE
jgi:hypothetical protein